MPQPKLLSGTSGIVPKRLNDLCADPPCGGDLLRSGATENNPADAADCRRGETNVPIVPIGGWGWRKNFRIVQRTGMRNFRSFMGQMLTEREIWIGNCLAIRLPDDARLVTIYLENGSTHR